MMRRFLRSKPFYFWFGILCGAFLIACLAVYSQRPVFSFRYKDKVGQAAAGESAWLDGKLRPLGYGMASSGSLDCRWSSDPALDTAECFAAVDIDGAGVQPGQGAWLDNELADLHTALTNEGWRRAADDYGKPATPDATEKLLASGGNVSIHYLKVKEDGITCDLRTSFNTSGIQWVSELRCLKRAHFFLLHSPSREEQ